MIFKYNCDIIISQKNNGGKKMAKKKNLKIHIPAFIALGLGIIAFFMMFLDAVSYPAVVTSVEYTGAQLVFGDKDLALTFNIMLFLAFVLPIAGGVLTLLGGDSFLFKILSTACFVVAAVFLFMTTVYAPISFGDASEIVKEANAKLCAGPIIAGILSILGAIVCFFKKTIAKKFS